jgi:hypothetical protein
MNNLEPNITDKAANITEITSFSNNKYDWESSDSIDAAPYYAATELSLMLVS